MIDFPGLYSFTNNSIYNSLKNDLIISAWKYIESELAGNIDSYLRMYPVDLVDKPLFSIFFNNNIIEQVEIYLTAFSFIREVILYKFSAGITSASYDVLDNNLSKIICYAIKREQIANQETRVNEYSYTYFQKIVRFKLKNKKKNLQLIQESLQEFVDNHIAIEKFELKNGVFIITFLPLSDAEIEDLNSDNDKNDKGLLIDTLG